MKDIISRNAEGQLHGAFEIYLSNGQLWVKTTYKNDKLHGAFERYYSNGQLCVKTAYKNGKRHGNYERYHDNGKLCVKTTYKDGVEVKGGVKETLSLCEERIKEAERRMIVDLADLKDRIKRGICTEDILGRIDYLIGVLNVEVK